MDEIRALYTAFVDVLFALVALFLMVINPTVHASRGQPSPVMSLYQMWTEGRDIDMDLYVKAPDGHTIWFRNKSDGAVVWLDRDDVGTTAGNGNLNMEVVKWGDLLNGHYLMSTHVYANRENPQHHAGDSVTVELFDKTGGRVCGKTQPIPDVGGEVPWFDVEIRNGYPYCTPSTVKLREALRKEHEVG